MFGIFLLVVVYNKISPAIWECFFLVAFFSDNEFKPKVVETPKDSDGNFLWVCKLMF